MKAQELRIGNWFKGDRPCGGEYQITPNDIENLHDDPQDDFYQPIPLTEEWLVKFGFENQISKWRTKSIDSTCEIDIHLTDMSVLLNISGGNESESTSLNHIKHVHQLQNLYFALTDEELETK